MNTFSHGGPVRKPSKLVDMIRNLAGSHGGASVGFRSVDKGRKRVTAVIATLSAADGDALGAALSAGVDALEISVHGAKDATVVADAVSRFSGPVGVTVKDADAALAEAVADAGADWVRLPLDAPVASMAWPRPARVLTVPYSLDLQLALGIGGLNVDAVLIDTVKDDRSEITYLDALRLRALSSFVKNPVLLKVSSWLPPSAAAAAEHLGADALLIQIGGSSAPSLLANYLEALEQRADQSR